MIPELPMAIGMCSADSQLKLNGRFAWGGHLFSTYESLWSLAHKFAGLNLVSPSLMKKYLQLRNLLTIYYGYALPPETACPSEEHIQEFFGLSKYGLDFSMVDAYETLVCSTHPRHIFSSRGMHYAYPKDNLRFCIDCMALGFHSPLYQLGYIKVCLLHDRELQESCPQCGKKFDFSFESLRYPYGCCCGYEFFDFGDLSDTGVMHSRRKAALQVERIVDQKQSLIADSKWLARNTEYESAVSFYRPSPDLHPKKIDLSIPQMSNGVDYKIDLNKFRKRRILSSTTAYQSSNNNLKKILASIFKSYTRCLKKSTQHYERLIHDRVVFQNIEPDPIASLEIFYQNWVQLWLTTVRNKSGFYTKDSILEQAVAEFVHLKENIHSILSSVAMDNEFNLDAIIDTILYYWFSKTLRREASRLSKINCLISAPYWEKWHETGTYMSIISFKRRFPCIPHLTILYTKKQLDLNVYHVYEHNIDY